MRYKKLEAQRAWNAEQSKRKFKRDVSEPEIMIDIMNRHLGWAVIVALVGGGQEINTGEAGLRQWGQALNDRFRHWKVLISPHLATGSTSADGDTDRKSTRLNSSHLGISYAVFC